MAPRSAMLICSGCRKMPWPGRQSSHMFGVFRMVPSPLHGTSASTRSNHPTPGMWLDASSLRVSDGNRWAWWVVASRQSHREQRYMGMLLNSRFGQQDYQDHSEQLKDKAEIERL